jgi:hypothetical protein
MPGRIEDSEIEQAVRVAWNKPLANIEILRKEVMAGVAVGNCS